jgi:riboflavin biosynthesis pyrimidine reductase
MEKLPEEKPYINCFMIMTIDGKVTGNFLSSEKCSFFLSLYNKMNKEFKVDGFICGKTTMNESYTNDYFPDLTKIKKRKIKKVDFIVKNKNKNYAIAFDRRGTLGWKNNILPGSKDKYIIQIMTENVDNDYLIYLQQINISYIFAGNTDINIPLALKKLKKNFGINKLMLEGGSTINGAFLKANCIDEINLIVVPMTGEKNDKSLFGDSVMSNFKLVKFNHVGKDGLLLCFKSEDNDESEESESED